MSSLEQVLELVEKLSKQDKQELLARLALETKLGNKAKAAKHSGDRDEDTWFEEVVCALTSHLGGVKATIPSPQMLKRLQTDSWEHVSRFMEGSSLSKLTVVARRAVYRLLAGLVVDHASHVAKKSGAPLSAKLVLNCSGNVAGLFDNAFPGYLAAGMAPAVIRLKQGKLPYTKTTK